MNSKQLVKAITLLAFLGVVFDAAYAETESTSSEPAVEMQPNSSAPAVEKIQLSESNPATTQAQAENPAVSQEEAGDHAPMAAKAAAAKPSIIEWAVSGVAGLYERAKALVTQSGK